MSTIDAETSKVFAINLENVVTLAKLGFYTLNSTNENISSSN